MVVKWRLSCSISELHTSSHVLQGPQDETGPESGPGIRRIKGPEGGEAGDDGVCKPVAGGELGRIDSDGAGLREPSVGPCRRCLREKEQSEF